MLIQADYPNPEIGYYGSKVVTPYAQEIMEEILPYMGFYPEYTDEEAKEMNVAVPRSRVPRSKMRRQRWNRWD